jgi:hypothetical protein
MGLSRTLLFLLVANGTWPKECKDERLFFGTKSNWIKRCMNDREGEKGTMEMSIGHDIGLCTFYVL